MNGFRPTRFQILPPVIKNLIIINALVFFAQLTLPRMLHVDIDQMFALHYWGSPLFHWYQFITHMFMHGSFEHIFFNMFALWMFGSILENVWGPRRFLSFYLICGIGAAFFYMLTLTWRFHHILQETGITEEQVQNWWYLYTHHISGTFAMLPDKIQEIWIVPTLGASGAIFGVLVAFGYMFPNSMIYIYFFFPLKAKYFVTIYILIELFLGIQNSAGDNVAHFAHLGGALVGFVLMKAWDRHHHTPYDY